MCNPCSRASITAARFSRAAFSDPGRFSSRLLPLIPATARDSIARGVTFSPSIHMATGMAGISRSNNILPLGSLVFALYCCNKFGWGWDNFVAEANAGKGLKVKAWMKPIFRYLVPVAIIFIYIYGMVTFGWK